MRRQLDARRASLTMALLLTFGASLPLTAEDDEGEFTVTQRQHLEADTPSLLHRDIAASMHAYSLADESRTSRLRLQSTPFDPEVVELQDFRQHPVQGQLSGLFTTLGLGIFAASAGDLASTEFGLNRVGSSESNPFQRSRIVRVGSHAVAPVVVWWASDRLHAKGKTKLALIMRIGFTIAYGYATLHNIRAASSQP